MKLSCALILAVLCQWVSADVAHIKDSLADRQYLPPEPARAVTVEHVEQVHRHKPRISAYQYPERPRHTSHLHQQAYEGERYYDYAKPKQQQGRYSSYTPRALEAVEPTNRHGHIQRDFPSNLLPNYNLFAPANSNPYARNRETDRLITAPNSVFHTQINLQSQDNRFNVPNSLPPTSGGAARAFEAGFTQERYDDSFAARRIPNTYNAGRLVGACDDAQFNAIGLTQSDRSRALQDNQARALNVGASAQFSRNGLGLTDIAAVPSRSPQLVRTPSSGSLASPKAFLAEVAVDNLPRPLTNGNGRRNGGEALQLPIEPTAAGAQRSLPSSSAGARGAADFQGISGSSFGNIRGVAGATGASAGSQGASGSSFGNIRGVAGAPGASAGSQGASGSSFENIRGVAGATGASAGSQGASGSSFGDIRDSTGAAGVTGALGVATPTVNAPLSSVNVARSRDVVASGSASRNGARNAANRNAVVRTDLRDQRAPAAATKKDKSNYQALNLINGNVPADEVTRLATLSRSASGNAQGVNIVNGSVIAASARPGQVDSQADIAAQSDGAFEFAPSDSYAALIYAQNPYNAALHDRATAADADFRSNGYHYAEPGASSSF